MTNLLRANLLRLVKSATFWIFFSLYVIYSIALPFITHSMFSEDFVARADNLIAFGYGIIGIPIPGILIAIICNVFFGVEFHDRAVQNKIIQGYSRTKIYTANLLTACVISLAMSAVYMLFFLTISLPLYGKLPVQAKDITLLLIGGILSMISYSSIYTLIAMASKNQIVAILITLGTVIFITVIVNSFCLDVMNQQPYYTGHYDRYGEWVEEIVENPYYNKIEHDFCQFILDCFPSGQTFQLYNYNVYRWQPILYSLGLLAATTGAGITIFNKSNIK
ncbi:MAG: ABC transporter permease [Clostridia bacterium]|nr:ABC transporter permease [Clostridia bacterium]